MTSTVRTGARNWARFDDRMRTIGNLFRLRQHQPDLFDRPLPTRTASTLLAAKPPDPHDRPSR